MLKRLTLALCFLVLPLGLKARGAFYGSGVQGDALANTTLGPYGNQVSYRFRADPGGVLRGIRPFIIWSFRKAGYHAGTGGILKVELQEDDGSPAHLPSGKVLAANVQRLSIVPASDQFYPLITFDRAPALARGSFYHVVFANTHPQKEANFISVNALFSRAAEHPIQPTRGDDDWAMLFRNTGHPAWELRRTPGSREGFTPIMEVYYAAASQGVGYMEVWMGAGMPISGAARVGEVFTVGGPSRKVSAVSVRVRRVSGLEPLRITLTEDGGKPLCLQGPCAGPLPAVSPACSLGGCEWVTLTFPVLRTLAAGRTYHLVLSAPATAKYEAYPLRKGSDKGFTAATLFPDGHAEYDPGTGWRGWEQWGQKGRLDSDLQFYFTLAGPA